MTTFNDIAVGNDFHYAGTQYRKRSSRTASPAGRPTRWFYFGGKESVTV